MLHNNRILIVDDNKSIHEDFKKVLCNTKSEDQRDVDDLEKELFGNEESSVDKQPINTVEYEVDSAYQGQDALNMVQQAHEEGRPYALIFMDVRMPPGWDGVETISRIWLKHPYVEMVLCTAYSDYTWDEIITRLGTTDKLLFLRKPFDPIAVQQMSLTLIKKWNLGYQARNHVKQLEQEVRSRTIQLQELLAELETKNIKLSNTNKVLKHQSTHDSLTKLPNRDFLYERLLNHLQIAERENQRVAIFIVDVNDFKSVNDNLGHLTGDAVLYEVGERLALSLPQSGIVARLGGDEFALILPEIEANEYELLAKEIACAFEAPVEYGDASLQIRLSIGISIYPEHGKTQGELLKHADFAMYEAKRSKSGYTIFDIEEENKRLEKKQYLSDLKFAIDGNEFHIHYQPIIDIHKQQVKGIEALIRWMHPKKGLLSPIHFINLAENKGLIQKLTHWIFDVAFEQCATWHKMGIMLEISINLSTTNFLDPELPIKLENKLRKFNLEPKWIILEITENVTMSEPDKALAIISRLDRLGFSLSIDDFGTGYSSLSYLKTLPVNELKIDKSFIINMDKNDTNRVIVESTINLANALNLKVVAEGVENSTVYNILKTLGCNYAQGFHICRPKIADELEQWLLNSKYAIDDDLHKDAAS